MSFQFFLRFNSGLSLDSREGIRFSLIKQKEYGHLVSRHCHLIRLIKVSNQISRSKVQLPTQLPPKPPFITTISWHAVELLHIEVSKDVNSWHQLHGNLTTSLLIIPRPVPSRQHMGSKLKWDLISGPRHLETLIQFLWDLHILNHGFHLLSVVASAFLLEFADHQFLSLVIHTQRIQEALGQPCSEVAFKLIFIVQKSKDF